MASLLPWESRTCCQCFSQLGSGLSPSLDDSSRVCSGTRESKRYTLAASCHNLFSLVFICFFSLFDLGPAAGKESERTKMRNTDTTPTTSLVRWVVALSFLAMTVAVGLFAMWKCRTFTFSLWLPSPWTNPPSPVLVRKITPTGYCDLGSATNTRRLSSPEIKECSKVVQAKSSAWCELFSETNFITKNQR